MAGRGRASSQKRQKEMARLEKRQQKAQKKLERAAAGKTRESEELEPLDGPPAQNTEDDAGSHA